MSTVVQWYIDFLNKKQDDIYREGAGVTGSRVELFLWKIKFGIIGHAQAGMGW